MRQLFKILEVFKPDLFRFINRYNLLNHPRKVGTIPTIYKKITVRINELKFGG